MHSDKNSYKIDRRTIKLLVGEYVQYNNEIYKIDYILDSHELIGTDVKKKKKARLLISQLKLVENDKIIDNSFMHRDLSEFTEDDLAEIEKRFTAIQPILQKSSRTEIESYAKQAGVHIKTLYDWAKNYKSTGTLVGILPRKRGRIKGEVRIEKKAEQIIQNAIEQHYLTKIKPSVQYVINVVLSECLKHNISPPSNNTIRNRIYKITEYQRAKYRGSKSDTRTKFTATPGKYVVDYPLEVVQIDHTMMDVIIVDEESRQPIGRPFITVAIDIYSRMITGFYLSLDAPSGLSVAMCVANSILPKNEWLMEMGIDSNWDVRGIMQTLHADNGADFRAEALIEACLMHNINLQWRPVKKTNFGGHVERLIGTLMKTVHSIPGTTYSNIQQRFGYDSEGNASMTFHELEKWLVFFITKIYHKQEHSSLGMSPEEKWEEGIIGTETHPGIGLPPIPANPETLVIDFLPMVKRKIRKTGVHINNLQYYDFVLRPFIGEKENEHVFRINPNDISYIWFYDKDAKMYHKISLANRAIPKMSLSEYESIKKKLTPTQRAATMDAEIIRAHEKLREMTATATKKTKKVRRAEEKKKILTQRKSIVEINVSKAKSKQDDIPTFDNDFEDDEIPIFDIQIEGENNG